MRLLNLGCGGDRLPDPWVNFDTLHTLFLSGSPERAQLDAVPNYVDGNLLDPLPFDDNTFDGVLLSHVLEHFNCQDAVKILEECKRILHHGGVVVASVPDASYFRRVYPIDRNANWPQLFGVTDPKNPIPTFFEAALWFNEHFAILTQDALWAYFVRAGLEPRETLDTEVTQAIIPHLNRLEFSLVMKATRP